MSVFLFIHVHEGWHQEMKSGWFLVLGSLCGRKHWNRKNILHSWGASSGAVWKCLLFVLDILQSNELLSPQVRYSSWDGEKENLHSFATRTRCRRHNVSFSLPIKPNHFFSNIWFGFWCFRQRDTLWHLFKRAKVSQYVDNPLNLESDSFWNPLTWNSVFRAWNTDSTAWNLEDWLA